MKEEKHHCKYTALHEEYKQNRVHYDPVLEAIEDIVETYPSLYGISYNESTTEKTADITEFNLITGAIAVISFVTRVDENATLNISDTGARNITHINNNLRYNMIQAQSTAVFIYNGSEYLLLMTDTEAGSDYNNEDAEVLSWIKYHIHPKETVSNAEGKALGLIDIQSLIRYDDYDFPAEDNITSTKFPEQNEEYLGQTFALWYMLQNSIHEKEYGLFKVVRWDAEDPGIVMLINDLKKIILVSPPEYVLDDGTEEEDELGRKVYNSHVHYYPEQIPELVGLDVRDMYYKDKNFNYGIIIRADAGGEHPQYVVLETLADDSYRLITFKEAKSISSIYQIGPNNINKNYWPADWRNLSYEDNADNDSGGEGETEPD